MRRRFALALSAFSLLVAMVAVPTVAAGGNVDAARACQQGGSANLRGTDGTLFKNVGECVSFVAKGGTITGVSPACTYTAGVSGCIEFDTVVLPMSGFATTTTLSGMFSFPAIDWDPWVSGNAEGISGSGTWTTSTGATGTWTATHASSIYRGQFYNYDSSTGVGTPALCGAADTRYVGVHFDVFQSAALVGAFEIQVRNATYGTNYVLYQGFTVSPSGEPWGLHNTTDVSGVTFRC